MKVTITIEDTVADTAEISVVYDPPIEHDTKPTQATAVTNMMLEAVAMHTKIENKISQGNTKMTEQTENPKQENEQITEKYFDESEFVEKEIFPLVAEIHKKCVAHKIPLVVDLVAKNTKAENGDRSENILSTVIPGARTPDRIRLAAELLENGPQAVAKPLVMHTLKEMLEGIGNVD